VSTVPEERDLAHEADMERLRREQLRGEDFDGEELMGDPDEYDYDEPVCERCHGDGMDPWNDYLFECPNCQGRQTP